MLSLIKGWNKELMIQITGRFDENVRMIRLRKGSLDQNVHRLSNAETKDIWYCFKDALEALKNYS